LNPQRIENEILKLSARRETTRIFFRIFSRIERFCQLFNISLRTLISISNESRGKSSFSESLQDKFALEIGKKAGLKTYIEIGSGHPHQGSNSYQLEMSGWRGFSVELDPELVIAFKELRENPVYCADGTSFEYSERINELSIGTHIGYLQVDIDPSAQSLLTLLKIPFSSHKFASITFEHDSYRSSAKIRRLEREFLTSFGYVLMASNVKVNRLFAYEDWWVHPDLVNITELELFKSKNKHPVNMNWGAF
jgi:hypothetical protein